MGAIYVYAVKVFESSVLIYSLRKRQRNNTIAFFVFIKLQHQQFSIKSDSSVISISFSNFIFIFFQNTFQAIKSHDIWTIAKSLKARVKCTSFFRLENKFPPLKLLEPSENLNKLAFQFKSECEISQKAGLFRSFFLSFLIKEITQTIVYKLCKRL